MSQKFLALFPGKSRPWHEGLHIVGLFWELIEKPRDGDGMSGQEWREGQSRACCGEDFHCLSVTRTCFLGCLCGELWERQLIFHRTARYRRGATFLQESVSFEEGKAWDCGCPPALSWAIESEFLEGNTHRERRNCVQKERYCPSNGRCHPAVSVQPSDRVHLGWGQVKGLLDGSWGGGP